MSASELFFPGRDLSSQAFTSSGTFNVPDGVTWVFVDMWGGGGGGGSAVNGLGDENASGGEAGQRVQRILSVTPGAAITVTIGAGGAGGVNTGPFSFSPGSFGGNSSFGSLTASGGIGGNAVGVDPTLNFGGFGRRSNGANGGTTATSGGSTAYGGDAGRGAGGNGSASGNGANAAANTAAGGGASIAGDGGNGGSGHVTVFWIAP